MVNLKLLDTSINKYQTYHKNGLNSINTHNKFAAKQLVNFTPKGLLLDFYVRFYGSDTKIRKKHGYSHVLKSKNDVKYFKNIKLL